MWSEIEEVADDEVEVEAPEKEGSEFWKKKKLRKKRVLGVNRKLRIDAKTKNSSRFEFEGSLITVKKGKASDEVSNMGDSKYVLLQVLKSDDPRAAEVRRAAQTDTHTCSHACPSVSRKQRATTSIYSLQPYIELVFSV